MFSPSLEKLSSELSRLPGVGPKTALRLSYFILRSPKNYVEALSEALIDVKEKIKLCEKCYSYTEQDICKLCLDFNRDDGLLCIVENPSDIPQIDSSGAFRGRYHVLHGVISPMEGISPKDLKIEQLFKRVQSSQNTDQPIKEVVLALDADLEGDTTALYIAKTLKTYDINVTRIAHGIPIGGDIDYIDHRTLGRALENRVQI